MVKELPEEDLSLKIGSSPIGYLIRHSAEVEYMFADWYFVVQLLTASNEHLIEAMRKLQKIYGIRL